MTKTHNAVIFCDFDGTITKEDTIDKLLSNYASDTWLEIEKEWEKGLIGSKECLERQIECIEKFSENQLVDFISTVEIDEGFPAFYEEIKNRNIDFYIISDGFDLFIEKTLEKYGLTGIKTFSNSIKLENQKLNVSFPNHNAICEAKSGLCKCIILKKAADSRHIIYIGDGRSDMCACKHAGTLFAKKKLAEHAGKKAIKFIEFNTFKDITCAIRENMELENIDNQQHAYR